MLDRPACCCQLLQRGGVQLMACALLVYRAILPLLLNVGAQFPLGSGGQRLAERGARLLASVCQVLVSGSPCACPAGAESAAQVPRSGSSLPCLGIPITYFF